MKWFGEPWPSADRPAPVCEDPVDRVPVPVGEPCLHCREEVSSADRGVIVPYWDYLPGGGPHPVVYSTPYHAECWLRTTMGGLGHLLGRCVCCGGEEDPDLGKSPREGARAVWDALMRDDR